MTATAERQRPPRGLAPQSTSKARAARPKDPKNSLRQRIWRARWSYMMMVPGLVLILAFSIYPLIASWYYSFFNWDGITANPAFIGIGNYLELLRDGYFWRALGRTLVFAGVATPVELAVSLAFALVLNNPLLRARSVYRTMIFVPVVTTTAIVSIVMTFVFSAFNGPVNQILIAMHLISTPINFLGDPSKVLWVAIGIFIWKWCGNPMIYWLAGLQSIPGELYEAAKIDGAPRWRSFTNITMPLLRPYTTMITIIVLAGNLQVFAFMQALTGGGPFFSSEVMELYIYRMAFGATVGGGGVERLGYASAAGVLFGLLLMVVGIAQLLLVRQLRKDRKKEVLS
jgi:raffinose/stachyose/melibiose transport system permease protein